MKKYLILINLLIVVISLVLTVKSKKDLQSIADDYSMEENYTKNLAAQYEDSVSTLRFHYNNNEIFEYARKIENDSLRHFILRQASQSEHFKRVQNRLESHLSVINYAIVKKNNYYSILIGLLLINLVMCIIGFYSVKI